MGVILACFYVFGVSPSSQILLYMPSKYSSVSSGSLFIICGCIVSSPGAVFFCCFMTVFSSLSVNVYYMVDLHLSSFSVFLWLIFLMGLSKYICIVICKIIYNLVRWGDSIPPLSSSVIILGLLFPITFLKLPHAFLVGVLVFSEFTNLFHTSFLVFLKTVCLMAFLRWNDLNLVLFVGSRWCFLYSALTILSSLSNSSFHHATSSLIFASEDGFLCCL